MALQAPTVQRQVRQHPERQVSEEAEILLAGLVAHVGFLDNGKPCVIPFSYHFDDADGNRLFLHGGRSSHTLANLSGGASVCVTVTLVDGLVYSKSAMYHSMNYRSVVCFGTARLVEDAMEKAEKFEAMTLRYFPGRTAGQDYEAATSVQIGATTVIEVSIESWSAKARRGGPKGPNDNDPSAPGSSGVVSLIRG